MSARSERSGVIGRIHRRVTRATLAPLLVRFGVLCALVVSMVLAYPVQFIAGPAGGLLLLVVVLPAVAPRRAWATVALLIAVAGWLISTSWDDEPIELWRLLGLATFLYLSHSLCALAALLPHDAVVAPEVLARWVSRALAVAFATAVLAVLLLSLTGQLA